MRLLPMRILVVMLVLAGFAAGPVEADRARQESTPTPTVTPRYLRLSPAPPTRTPRVTPTPQLGREPEGTPPRVEPLATPFELPGTRLPPAESTPPGVLPTPAPTLTPEALPETGVTPAPGGAARAFDRNLLRNLAQFDSYLTQTTIRWDLDDGRSGNADITAEVSNHPAAQRWLLQIEEANEPGATYEFRRVNDQTYMSIRGDWRRVSPSVELLLSRFSSLVDPQTYMDLSACAFVGVETVNGLESDHYRCDEGAFEASMGVLDLEDAGADIWIAQAYDVYAQVQMRLVGTDPMANRGVYRVETDLVGIDVPVSIPEPAVGAPGELPATGETPLILADAINLPMFDIYRLAGSFRWDMEDGSAWRGEFQVDVDQQRPAERAMLSVGQGVVRIPLEYVDVEGAAWVRRADRWLPARCYALPALVQQLGWIGDPRRFTEVGAGRFVARETINGIQTRHYVLNRDAFGQLPFLTEIQDATADVWYSPAYDAYIRIVMDVTGVDTREMQGDLHLETELVDIDEAITIELPRDLPETTPECP